MQAFCNPSSPPNTLKCSHNTHTRTRARTHTHSSPWVASPGSISCGELNALLDRCDLKSLTPGLPLKKEGQEHAQKQQYWHAMQAQMLNTHTSALFLQWLHAAGCIMPFAASCCWLHHAIGCIMPLAASCHWLHHAAGCMMLLGARCCWVHDAAGCIMLLAASCRWVYHTAGYIMPLAASCRWVHHAAGASCHAPPSCKSRLRSLGANSHASTGKGLYQGALPCPAWSGCWPSCTSKIVRRLPHIGASKGFPAPLLSLVQQCETARRMHLTDSSKHLSNLTLAQARAHLLPFSPCFGTVPLLKECTAQLLTTSLKSHTSASLGSPAALFSLLRHCPTA
eukprot:1161846-Pelagomonas_calceolata.AAC.6